MLVTDNSAFCIPEYEGFTPLCFPLQSYTFLNVWHNKEAHLRFESVVKDGILKHAPAAAEIILHRFDKLAELGLEDDVFIKELKKTIQVNKLKEEKDRSFNLDEEQRVRRRALQITGLLKGRPRSYLDIGCGNGHITECLSRYWKLNKSKAVGTDVHKRIEGNTSFKYMPMNEGKIPIKSGSIELATMLMTLHHNEDAEGLIKEVYRVLKPGGVLIIRDHDAGKISDSLLFEALDTLYFSIFNELDEIPQPGKYKTAKFWQNMAGYLGFETLKLYMPEPQNPMNPFHLVLRKPI